FENDPDELFQALRHTQPALADTFRTAADLMQRLQSLRREALESANTVWDLALAVDMYHLPIELHRDQPHVLLVTLDGHHVTLRVDRRPNNVDITLTHGDSGETRENAFHDWHADELDQLAELFNLSWEEGFQENGSHPG